MPETDALGKFESVLDNGIGEALGFLVSHFLDSGEYHRLFDVRKMQIRQSLNLPLLHHEDDPPLDEVTQAKLEEGLLEACREIAKLYLGKGNLNDGWIYLQPLCDEPLAAELIEGVEVTDENFASIIEIAFNNGVSPVYGYQVMLEKSGTCNGITAFDMHAMQFDRKTAAELASVLLDHFYNEILSNAVEHVRRVEGDVSDSASLADLLQQHEWLVREGGHHADATHLASVIRIARQTTALPDHEKALALANYGCRLGEDFHFSSDPPFENLYEDHRFWFEALSGKNVGAGIGHFSAKADVAKGQYYETSAVEALIDLQIRTGNRDAAVDSMVSRVLGDLRPEEVPASAFEIAKTPEQFAKVGESFKSSDNFAGYAFAMLRREEVKDSGQ